LPERLEIHITGRVQGVGFRWHTRQQARDLALVGWVRNLPDGTVQVLAEGERVGLERLLLWCRSGPPSAGVFAAESRWAAATGEFAEFRITG
jgi:acylphosphatase